MPVQLKPWRLLVTLLVCGLTITAPSRGTAAPAQTPTSQEQAECSRAALGVTICYYPSRPNETWVIGEEPSGGNQTVTGGAPPEPECVPTWVPETNPGLIERGITRRPVGCLERVPVPDSDLAAQAAASAVARLRVPEPQIIFGPEPSVNKWNVLAVGFPIWVWLADPGPQQTTVDQDGIEITLTATQAAARFDWGDGQVSNCATMRQRPAQVEPLTPSPDCGHSYLTAGDYTVTATAQWDVAWTALGYSGTLPLSATGSRDLPIREFASVVVG